MKKITRLATVVLSILMFVLLAVGCSSQKAVPAKQEAAQEVKQETKQPEVKQEAVKNESKYPEKPITVLQGFKQGGGSDALAQLTQPFLQKILGQTFVNQYKPGATGAIAWTELSTVKPDGYIISITNTPMLQANYIMNDTIKYKVADFDPIANVVTDPGIVVVGKDSKFKTIQDVLDYAKNNPGKLTVGNSGVGGDDFFTTLLTMKKTDLEFEMVPFQGDGPSWQAAMGGHIDVSFNNLGITYSQIQAGNLRALAIMSEERFSGLPDVPTWKELGFDVVAGSSRGYSAPKGLPQDVKDKLVAAFDQMGKDPAFLKAAEEQALPVDIILGDDYKKFLEKGEQEMTEIWNEVKDQFNEKK